MNIHMYRKQILSLFWLLPVHVVILNQIESMFQLHTIETILFNQIDTVITQHFVLLLVILHKNYLF
jgi:hypothetical protein